MWLMSIWRGRRDANNNMLPVVKGDWGMKIFKSYLIFLCFLLCLCESTVFGFSTHNTTISRIFDRVEAVVGESVTVIVSFTNNETNDLRGFYYTEQIPDGLLVTTVSVEIDGSGISNYTADSGSSGEVYAGSFPYRWVLESPTDFSENNTISENSIVEIVYSVTSSQAGDFDFDEFNWVGYYQTAPEGERAAFGHSEDVDKQTIAFTEAPLFGDELAVDFGVDGLWHYDGAAWSQLNALNPSGIEEWSGGCAADFSTSGLWNYDGASWSQLTALNPAVMEAWDSGIAVDFDASGLWYYDGSSWSLLTTNNAENLQAWSGGLAADFGGIGLWSYNGSSWSLLTTSNASGMESWANGLAVDFGGIGLWNYNGSSWGLLTTNNPTILQSWAHGLAANFGSGLWSYDGSSWGLLTTSYAYGMADWNNGLAVDFNAFGLWSHDGSSWSLLTTTDPDDMEGWASGLASDLGGVGLWNYDGSTWSLLTTLNAEDMTDVDLY